jgi:hypothetical protein
MRASGIGLLARIPTCTWSSRRPEPGIYGVDRSLFARRFPGGGKILGVRFRAGCLRPFWDAPISQLSDRVDQAGDHVRQDLANRERAGGATHRGPA